ncbi:carbon-nitrogen hydrolase family protein [Pseudovibrio sp. SPO723]|uniref:carbon-nitrogen hydrolase family protein n=1 Tax=Nesiotobacter zosterae TaxID=392721 RepID=UPI0029C24A7A|nr:carbon-nitrogen hydrolase family protein [Pseudovibrio sp. SPO723]MDX5592367.1 carbon-nitrogen hydrolase family protein [Pseudovibrio sp. SPO723]
MKLVEATGTVLSPNKQEHLKVGIAQIAPIWLNRAETLDKVIDCIDQAAEQACKLVVFGEAMVPGYPFWLERTDGARFNDAKQKALYAHYVDQSVTIERGDLDGVCEAAKAGDMAVYLGVMERAPDRSGHSLYCSLVYINNQGEIGSVHRKLQPTYEERLAWAPGDGHGLRVHELEPFKVGGLNCFENWMPLSRAALYAQGEDLHVAVWPGGLHNTEDTTRFIAKESRSYVLSASGLMRPEDCPEKTPARDEILSEGEPYLANGGSCIAAPDGSWVVPPQVGDEVLITAVLDHSLVRGERQNFDPAGHYSRPDVTRLHVNRKRQALAEFED